MNSADLQAFREYVTRVSFNLTMSRNQVAALRDIVIMIEHGHEKRMDLRQYEREQFGYYGNFVIGARWLGSHGLVKHTDPTTMQPPWSKCPWELTEAGEHVVGLLRLAGLIPAKISNNNKQRKKKIA